MYYAEYGLDTEKKSKDDDYKSKSWRCLWCNKDKTEHAFSLCFANFVICSSCIDAAFHYADQQHRWDEEADCWKCHAKPVKGFRNHPEFATPIYLCEKCLRIARKLIDGFAQQKQLNKIYFETMVQDIINRCAVEGLVVKLPKDTLERDVYLQVKKKLEGIGGKWKGGKTQGFVFEDDPTELLAQIQAGENVNLKKDYQFFPTPPEIAQQMASYLPPTLKDGYKILEPSAGRGALITAVQEHFGFDCEIDVYELMEQNVTKLRTMPGVQIKGNDFLLADGKTLYDIIIANPPFTKNQDIDHIRLMYDLLKPGGMLITLCSPSFTFAQQTKQTDFKAWLEMIDVFPLRLEPKSFASSGTNITPVLLQFVKPVEATDGVVSFQQLEKLTEPRKCRVCSCTEEDCSQCIEKTGIPCHWVEADLCSACVSIPQKETEQAPANDSITSVSTDEIPHDSPKEEAGSEDIVQPLHPDSPATDEEEKHTEGNEPAAEPLLETSHHTEEVQEPISEVTNEEEPQIADTENDPPLITTNFFSELKSAMHMLAPDVTLRVSWKDDKLRVIVIPNNGIPSGIAPISLAGTEEEMNTEFFSYLSETILKKSRELTDMPAYNKKIAEAKVEAEKIAALEKKETPPAAAKVAADAKPAAVKKPEAKKPEPKKEKKEIPSLFV